MRSLGNRPDLLAAGQLALGVAALLAPHRGAKALGFPHAGHGEAELAWRLFGARQLCLGAGGWAGLEAARDVNLILQPIDLAVFVHGERTGSVPRRAARVGMAAATFAFATALAGRRGTGAPRRR